MLQAFLLLGLLFLWMPIELIISLFTLLYRLQKNHLMKSALTIKSCRSDYQQLVFSALSFKNSKIKVMKPCIMKPCELWSGKQVSNCWRAQARQHPILYISEKKAKSVGCKTEDMHS